MLTRRTYHKDKIRFKVDMAAKAMLRSMRKAKQYKGYPLLKLVFGAALVFRGCTFLRQRQTIRSAKAL